MSTSFFQKYKYDIALKDGIGGGLITWVTGLMVFFMTLMLTVNIALAAVSQNWISGLTGSLTVEIKPPLSTDSTGKTDAAAQKTFNDNVAKITGLSKQHPAITEARALSRDEIISLIEPWLGEKLTGDLPLPALIDIKLAPDADTQKLQSDILALVPSATIDSHQDTLDDVRTLINTIRAFVMLLTGVIVTLAVIAISGIVRAKFSIHRGETEILHLLGASDEYIARQFRHHTLQGTLKGAVIGVVCMVVTLLIIGIATRTISAAILPPIQLLPLHWLLLIFAPVIGGIVIAHITAQATAIRALSRMS